ncbi:MAG: hypothetical protein ACP5Q3_11380, partial [bacterium]
VIARERSDRGDLVIHGKKEMTKLPRIKCEVARHDEKGIETQSPGGELLKLDQRVGSESTRTEVQSFKKRN